MSQHFNGIHFQEQHSTLTMTMTVLCSEFQEKEEMLIRVRRSDMDELGLEALEIFLSKFLFFFCFLLFN
jgi:hypothetical protein